MTTGTEYGVPEPCFPLFSASEASCSLMCIMSAHYVAQKSTHCLSYRVLIVGDSDVLPYNEFLTPVLVCGVSCFPRADMETLKQK
jgi:hypothetical protein